MDTANGTQQPSALPAFRWRPERVRGIPICLDILPLMAETPIARFHENEKPYFLPIAHSFSYRALYYHVTQHVRVMILVLTIRSAVTM